MATMPRTASELLLLFQLLPESEQALMLERLTASASEFDDQKFTETYKGFVIEVYRSKEEEQICGPECWTADYINSDGRRIIEGGTYDSAEECLKATHETITWELEQVEIRNSFKEVLHQFKAKGFIDANILNGFADAVRYTIDESDWREEVIQNLDKAARSAPLPGQTLP